MSSSEVAARSTAVAAALAGLDICPEDRVLILLPDGPGFVEVFSGITRLGAVALPVNPQLSMAEVLIYTAETGARMVVGWAEQVRENTTDLEAKPLMQVDRSRALSAAALRPH